MAHVHDFFATISVLVAKDPKVPLLFGIGGGLLFTMVGDFCDAWFTSAVGTGVRGRRAGFSLQKGGPVAAHYDRGNAFMRSGDASRAIECFGKALRLNPNYAAAWIGRGLALCETGDYENAIADLSEALVLDSKNAEAYYYHGIVLEARGDYAGAIADYDRSLRLRPRQKNVRQARVRAMAKIAKTQP
jgi:tetratricopeptide (TPR) repeat protein